MEIYLILAISFAIMYYVRYTREIISIIEGVAGLFDNTEHTFKPIIYIVNKFILTSFLWPLYILPVFTKNRYTYIKECSTEQLKAHYGLEEIKN